MGIQVLNSGLMFQMHEYVIFVFFTIIETSKFCRLVKDRIRLKEEETYFYIRET